MVSFSLATGQTSFYQYCTSSCSSVSLDRGSTIKCCQTDNCNTFNLTLLPPPKVSSCYSGGYLNYNNIINLNISIAKKVAIAPYNQYCVIEKGFDSTQSLSAYSYRVFKSASACVPQSIKIGRFGKLTVRCCQTNDCNLSSNGVQRFYFSTNLKLFTFFFILYRKTSFKLNLL